eukprot:TRINITY_DN25737_c0_g2_i1.p1 TRINITY_DN25737_c0_g2~~TRINITY_DN25737_c0_g2_i1.p1  ORF type:complete len:571 (+),score=94.93 TRINITY_DN25737_c0_g2_i1:45-1715(+)
MVESNPAVDNALSPLRSAQEAWLEKLLVDTELCDSIAIVGAEAQIFPIHRAIVGNVSEPLRKAFYGDFLEGRTKEIALPEVSPEAFRCLVRCAVGLDPDLEPTSVVPTLQMAEMFMVHALAEECRRYIRCVQPEDILSVLTACLTLGYELPEEVERSYWCTVLLNSEKVVQSPSFAMAHSDIISRLVKLDEFGVSEECLWLRLVEWAANTQKYPELLGDLGEFEDNSLGDTPSKRRRIDCMSPFGVVSELQVLQHLRQHVRFPAMDMTFFANEVRSYLSREESESVMLHHLLQRPSVFSSSKRTGLPRAKVVPLPIELTALHCPAEAQRLSQGGAAWRLNRVAITMMILDEEAFILKAALPESSKAMVVTKVCLTFASPACWPAFELSTACGTFRRTENAHGRSVAIKMQMYWQSPPPSHSWKIIPKNLDPQTNYADLVRVEIAGKLPAETSAAEVVSARNVFVINRRNSVTPATLAQGVDAAELPKEETPSECLPAGCQAEITSRNEVRQRQTTEEERHILLPHRAELFSEHAHQEFDEFEDEDVFGHLALGMNE